MQLRKDYILNRWSYISGARAKRPHNYQSITDNNEAHPKNCPFCFNREYLTPEEIGRVEKIKGKWLVRWFLNKYPALTSTKTQKEISNNRFFQAYSSFGIQEVIIETPDKRQMVDLSVEHISIILKVYNHRIEELSKIKGIEYVMVFKNRRKGAGASIVHSHSQVIATGKIPALIEQEILAFNQYNSCPYCDIIKAEQSGPRKVFENENFIAFTPYAPRFNYEIWIFPKAHMKKMNEMKDWQYFDLAEILKKILKKINEINTPYCFYIQYGVGKTMDFHWHIEILPRVNIKAGFELSGGDSIISVSPEEAAEFYKGIWSNC